MQALSNYVQKYSKLRVDRSKGMPAPHKPVLLLSIIEGISKKEIEDNRIYITPELVAQFKDYWHQLVTDTRFTSNFSLPFYHLKSDGFWHLKMLAGKELILTSSYSIKSLMQLKQTIDYAYLDEVLFSLLLNEHTRQVLRQTLLTTYFSKANPSSENNLIGEIIHQILHDPSEVYKTKAADFDEEEVFVRSGVFKKQIPKVYNYTCSISGMRIITDAEVQMIDACHIIPFSESHDDTISNGISLCPNLHRAFDRG
jgi:putative restriction endonuclease